MQSLREVYNMIGDTIDFQMSEDKHRTCVKQGVDATLDELKRQYDGIESMLTHIVNHVVAELPEWGQQYVHNCIFYPQLGFLMVVAVDEVTGKGKYEGEGIDGEVWTQVFVNTNMGYYKTNRMLELDAQFGDLEGRISG
jgi:DNA mismatch repair protein MSH5